MADKVHPTNQNPTTTAPQPHRHSATSTPIPNPPPTKTHPTRHPYHPTPSSHRRHAPPTRRRCLCLTCFYSFLILLLLLLIAAVSAAAFNVLYHPQRPSFSVTAVKISAFNLTTATSDDTTTLSTNISITLSAKNPNKHITFLYDAVSITVLSNSVNLSNGSCANFTSWPEGIFVIHAATASMNYRVLDVDSVDSLRLNMKRRKGLPMNIVMDTMVGVKMEKLKMKKIGIRVNCHGIHGVMPKGKNVTSVANTSRAKCKVDLRFKILKRSFL